MPSGALTIEERRRRLERVAAYLVRTIDSCPAPGVPPWERRDWLLLAAAIGLPYLLVIGLASTAHRS